jgi:hypothetical protein
MLAKQSDMAAAALGPQSAPARDLHDEVTELRAQVSTLLIAVAELMRERDEREVARIAAHEEWTLRNGAHSVARGN